jgi:hypothetical protein
MNWVILVSLLVTSSAARSCGNSWYMKAPPNCLEQPVIYIPEPSVSVCYHRDGSVASNMAPCFQKTGPDDYTFVGQPQKPAERPADHMPCCPYDESAPHLMRCGQGSICYSRYHEMSPATCTDKTYKSGACSQLCTNSMFLPISENLRIS